MRYKDSGVDQEKAKRSIQSLTSLIENTHHKAKWGKVIAGVGGFSGVFRPRRKDQNYDVVATTDGVGTKIVLCSRFSYLEPLGYDLVAMCVNDLYCSGADPAFFLDYVSCGKLSDHWYQPVIQNIAKACETTGMALLGGETAEHPGVMGEGEFDLAGFCVGFRGQDNQLPRLDDMSDGDHLIALPSSGLHSNGFSLVRMILDEIRKTSQTEYDAFVRDQKWIHEHLLAPTRIYTEIPSLLSEVKVKAIAHITGGGIYENLPRVLPKHLSAVIDKKIASRLKVYQWLSRFVPEEELFHTFNMGYGMILVVDPKETQKLLNKKKEAICIGHLEERRGSFSEVFITGK